MFDKTKYTNEIISTVFKIKGHWLVDKNVIPGSLNLKSEV